MAADTLDVLTFAEARSALKYGATHTDAALEEAITAVSRRFDRLFGAMVRRTVTEDVPTRGGTSVTLQCRPVVAGSLSACLTTVTGGTLYTEGTETSVDVFPTVELEHGELLAPSWPAGTVEAVYQAGRYATTATVDALVKHAAILTLRNLWESSVFDTVNADGYETPGVSFPTVDVPSSVWNPAKRSGLLADMARLPAVG